MSSHPISLEGNNQAGDLAPKVARFGLGLAVVGLGIGALLGFMSNNHDGYSHFWFAYLVAFCFVMTIVLGSLFFNIIQHLVNAHWSVSVRRLSELTMSTIPLMALFALPLLVPLFSDNVEVFKWATMAAAEHGAVEAGHEVADAAAAVADGHAVEAQHDLATELAHAEHEHYVSHKFPFLNRNFFALRLLGYFLLWWWMARFFFKRSVAQDTAEGIDPTLGMKRLAPVGTILFAFTISFFAFDMLMSLDETWFSTIFGVYIFAGAYLGAMCWLVLMSKFLQAKGRVTAVINDEHYHDLGKWMFAFVFFWGYIAFSQFMLIWYANIPEETHFYEARLTDAWSGWTWALLIFHFIIPFGGLLSRHVKRNTNILMYWAIYLLAMHWIDIYWLAMPNYHRSEAGASNPFGLMEIMLAAGMFGVLIYGVGRKSAGQALVPLRDPLLGKCLGFKNL
jgi:hypothetical protein